MEVEKWLEKKLDYFTDPDCELAAVTAELNQLQLKRCDHCVCVCVCVFFVFCSDSVNVVVCVSGRRY